MNFLFDDEKSKKNMKVLKIFFKYLTKTSKNIFLTYEKICNPRQKWCEKKIQSQFRFNPKIHNSFISVPNQNQITQRNFTVSARFLV